MFTKLTKAPILQAFLMGGHLKTYALQKELETISNKWKELFSSIETNC